jgi:tRNA threonylcarbamoyladenosine biosynthesis protein TsaB
VRILSVDTSTKAGGVAALEDDLVRDHVFEPSIEEFSSKLFRNLDLLLSRIHWKTCDFDLYAVTAGPGTFTGLRVGLTAVKAWGELYAKPIAAVSGLEAIAAQCTARAGLVAVLADARRGQVFGALYSFREGRLVLQSDEMLCSPAEFASAVMGCAGGEAIALISPSPEAFLPDILAAGLHPAKIERSSEDLAPWVGRVGFQQFKRGDVVDALSLDANYIRRSDAELYWKQS